MESTATAIEIIGGKGSSPSSWMQVMEKGQKKTVNTVTFNQYERHGNRLEEVKESARKLLVSTKDPHEQLDLIDTLQRLGVAYHFEREIKHILAQLVDPNIADDLRTVALQFRLLRQNGIFISTGDDMAKQVEESLEMEPLHWRVLWVEARNFIDIYERDEKRNLALLEFAKLNYNILQSVYMKELQELGEWDLGAIEELPEYMKPFYIAMYNHWLRYVEASIQETKWIYSGYIPTEDEYLQNAWITIGGLNSLNYAIVGVLGQNSMDKLLSEFIDNNSDPDIVYVPALIMRLLNDLSTDKVEMERGEALNLINCYMMQEGVSEEEARDYIKGFHQNLRKKLNKLVIQFYTVDEPCVANVAVTVMRSTHRIYQYRYDWFSVLNKADEACVMNSFFQPIPMETRKTMLQ
ncbi:hypothetical protein CCACVL1_06399 [Corchorus capsularis]|uniref:Uncharacterized protein n=1 Tax=Corchorus capsularis TaxID=210143 RepID=A0A1R3JFS0_COCAP|nr:hypothetical protein CCACVL1_06399 [Corchorus capsularis]